MKTLSFKSDQSDLDGALEKCKAINPGLVLFFAGPACWRDAGGIEKVKAAFPDAQVLGCSTAGEISADGVSDDTFSLCAMQFDSTEIKTAKSPLIGAGKSREAGKAVGDALNAPNLKGVFILSPALNVNGSDLVRGVTDAIGTDIVITGGIAGDGTDFGNTYTFLNGDTHGDQVIGFGLYGDKVNVRSGSRGGWVPFGPARRVTKVADNVLYELDDKPALQLYKEYLGDKAADLPASGLLFPFSIIREEDRTELGLIRSILNVDHDAESLILAGDLPEGSLVRMMHADTEALVTGAQEAAKEANGDAGDGKDTATLMVSCVGRKIIMGTDVDEEIDAVLDIVGKDSAVTGFYAYGEICPFSETGCSELHNQTMTITHISEDAA